MAKQSCGQPEAVANVDSSVASGDLRMTTHNALFDPLVVLLKGHGPHPFL